MNIDQISTIQTPPARRANDFLVHPKRFRAPEHLFDEFWREGELALFFGPPSSAKSILAVQLGDGLARGGGLPGFRHPRGRRRVLYADLRLSDEQFQMRCVHLGVRHRFPKNLFRDRPPVLENLCEWLIEYVTANRIQVVIIDDLSAVKNTHDGTRETLRLMRRLREIHAQSGISILVIADSMPVEGRLVCENDLSRSRVLCTVADSVFAIGRDLKTVGDHYLIQTRVRNAAIFWTERNAPFAQVVRSETGLLALKFDKRFMEISDEKMLRLICEISRLVEVEGNSFREVAAALGISKSWAATLYKRWTPAMDEQLESISNMSEPLASAGGQFDEEYGPWENEAEFDKNDTDSDYDDDDKDRDDEDAMRYGLDLDGFATDRPDEPAPASKFAPARIPFAAALARRLIRDLERRTDASGDEIFVQSADEHNGKPAVWFKQNRQRKFIRFERTPLGIQTQNLGRSGFVPKCL